MRARQASPSEHTIWAHSEAAGSAPSCTAPSLQSAGAGCGWTRVLEIARIALGRRRLPAGSLRLHKKLLSLVGLAAEVRCHPEAQLYGAHTETITHIGHHREAFIVERGGLVQLAAF